MSLDVDVDALLNSINQWFPIFFPVLALIGGIGIAIRLCQFLIREFQGAF